VVRDSEEMAVRAVRKNLFITFPREPETDAAPAFYSNRG
jgi:hypothetical protein